VTPPLVLANPVTGRHESHWAYAINADNNRPLMAASEAIRTVSTLLDSD
jgi:hypothetical protein